MGKTVTVLIVAGLLLTGGGLSAAEQPPNAVMAGKGLSKVGALYLLDADTKLAADVKAMNLAKAKATEAAKKKSTMEREIKAAEVQMDQWKSQYDDYQEKLKGAKTAANHNQYVKANNDLVNKLNEGIRLHDKMVKEFNSLKDPTDDYATIVLDLFDKLEAANKQYAALGDDAAVQAAMDDINRTASPIVKLGPSAEFTRQLTFLRKERGQFASGAIKCRMSGGVAVVNVTVNGTVVEPMIVDSGASLILLTNAAASRMGVKPTSRDPTIRCQLADGKVIEAKHMVLTEVKVGRFAAEKIDCGVLPASAKGIDCLLGGTYFKHFKYRMDLTAGVLYMSKLDPAQAPPAAANGQAALPEVAPPAAPPPADDPRKPAAGEAGMVAVPATNVDKNPLDTGVKLTQGQAFVLEPNPNDKWVTNPQTGKVDFHGHENGNAVMMWKIGTTTGLVVPGKINVAPEDGVLMLYCKDGNPKDNSGSIRCTISLK